MKRMIFAALLGAFVFGFSSCKKEAVFNAEDLLGRWQRVYLPSEDPAQVVNTGDFNPADTADKQMMYFLSDGSGSDSRYGRFNWNLKKSKLTCNFPSRTITYTIEELGPYVLTVIHTSGGRPSDRGYFYNVFRYYRP